MRKLIRKLLGIENELTKIYRYIDERVVMLNGFSSTYPRGTMVKMKKGLEEGEIVMCQIDLETGEPKYIIDCQYGVRLDVKENEFVVLKK